MNKTTAAENKQRSTKLCRLFDALGDTTRFSLVERLHADQDICVSDLAEKLKITPAGASQQLKTLERAGILTRVRKGQRICYQVNSEDSDVMHVLELINS
jgi:ArsR family transcriptional regulator